jgi:heterodisulfide reductase subunit A-like polyferredoxin
LIREDIRFLERYMAEQGYSTVQDFVGLALEHIKPANEITSTHDNKSLLAYVDDDKCGGCGVCADSVCIALTEENCVAKVNADVCSGCGMCVAICPRNAISLHEEDR